MNFDRPFCGIECLTVNTNDEVWGLQYAGQLAELLQILQAKEEGWRASQLSYGSAVHTRLVLHKHGEYAALLVLDRVRLALLLRYVLHDVLTNLRGHVQGQKQNRFESQDE
jgi:hypothetical protein